jgi:hypothetical protein
MALASGRLSVCHSLSCDAEDGHGGHEEHEIVELCSCWHQMLNDRIEKAYGIS